MLAWPECAHRVKSFALVVCLEADEIVAELFRFLRQVLFNVSERRCSIAVFDDRVRAAKGVHNGKEGDTSQACECQKGCDWVQRAARTSFYLWA